MSSSRKGIFDAYSPFYFHYLDDKMDKKLSANYIPANKRLQIKKFFERSSIKISHPGMYLIYR